MPQFAPHKFVLVPPRRRATRPQGTDVPRLYRGLFLPHPTLFTLFTPPMVGGRNPFGLSAPQPGARGQSPPPPRLGARAAGPQFVVRTGPPAPPGPFVRLAAGPGAHAHHIAWRGPQRGCPPQRAPLRVGDPGFGGRAASLAGGGPQRLPARLRRRGISRPFRARFAPRAKGAAPAIGPCGPFAGDRPARGRLRVKSMCQVMCACSSAG
jgi:hypothetical protein